MRGGSTRIVLRHLQTLYRCGVTGHQSDEQLLERFLARRDEDAEAAFRAIVERHGPMVLGVCLRVLGDGHDAEDAFQATFLVLARKAASVIRRDKVANWLYGVAFRTAKQARGRTARRQATEERIGMSLQIEPVDEDLCNELRGILDEELERLPARYRAPIVLCELEGMSRREAARRLGVPEGTISSRLARAKNQLRDRLARRGVGLPIALVSAALVREAGAATLSDALIESTACAAMCVAAGSTAALVVTASVVNLTEGVLKTMALTKMKGIALFLGALGAMVSGAVVLGQSNPRPVLPINAMQENTQQVAVPIAAKPGPPTSEENRTDAVERKLDRILNALDRLAGSPTGSIGGTARYANDPFEKPTTALPAPARNDAQPNTTVPVESTVLSEVEYVAPEMRDGASISARLAGVEKTLGATAARLDKLEARLAGLEKHVGAATYPIEKLERTTVPTARRD